MAEREYERNEGGQFGSNPFQRKAKEAKGGEKKGGGEKLKKWADDEKKTSAEEPKESKQPKQQEPHPEAKHFAEKVKDAKGLDPTPKRVWHDDNPDPANLPNETWQKHFDGDPTKGGKPTPERKAAVHDPIVQKALDVPPVAPGQKKVAVLTMGGPASGKSSGLGALEHDPNFVKVDPDAIKDSIPEFQHATRPEATWRKAAAMAHEESSYIAKQIRAQALERGNNVIIDGVGSDADKFIASIRDLKDRGYEVHLIMPHLTVDEALPRMTARAEKKGRYVPEKFVKDAYDKVPYNFEKIAAEVDAFRVVDTSSKAKARGAPVWEKQVGKEPVAVDPEFVDNFRKTYTR